MVSKLRLETQQLAIDDVYKERLSGHSHKDKKLSRKLPRRIRGGKSLQKSRDSLAEGMSSYAGYIQAVIDQEHALTEQLMIKQSENIEHSVNKILNGLLSILCRLQDQAEITRSIDVPTLARKLSLGDGAVKGYTMFKALDRYLKKSEKKFEKIENKIHKRRKRDRKRNGKKNRKGSKRERKQRKHQVLTAR